MRALFAVLFSVSRAEVVWTDAQDLGVRGRGNFTDSGPRAAYYDRFPAEAQAWIRDPVWSLSRNTAGFYLQFQTCSQKLFVNASYTSAGTAMWHFPSTGVAGLDLYAWDAASGAWRWASTTRNMTYPVSVSELSPLPSGSNRYRLHLPLYEGLLDLHLGHEPDCPLEPDAQVYPRIIWYGTSITQGAVASRPGMAFTNWIGREIDHEILNFGFSGNGLMELSVAKYLVQIPDPVLFVIDCAWNMQASLIAKNAVPLVQYIRQYHPDVPIVLAEDSPSGSAWTQAGVAAGQEAKRQALRAAFENLTTAGDAHLHYVEREKLFALADDPHLSPTVGGCHPSDLGMKAITDFYKVFLPPLLAGPSRRSVAPVDTLPQDLRALEAAAALEVDPSEGLVFQSPVASALHWVDVASLGILGRAFNDTETPYSRLPLRAKGVVRDDVYSLGLMSTGMFTAFTTNATSISLKYSLTEDADALWHMPPSGTSGADLYRWDVATETWGYVNAVNTFPRKGQFVTFTFANDLPRQAEASRYLLFFPMRKTVASAALGVEDGASLPTRDPAFSADGVTMNGLKPIVWYGTSIDQGGAVSRPGSTYTNRLTRKLGRMVLNFGFAGNGRMELDVARFLTEIDAEAFVIDCVWNMDAAQISNRTYPLVKYIQKQRPGMKIILAAGTRAGGQWFPPETADKRNQALSAEFKRLQDSGAPDLYFVGNEEDELYDKDELVNPTVGGVHPTDLGHFEMARYYTKYFNSLLHSSILV